MQNPFDICYKKIIRYMNFKIFDQVITPFGTQCVPYIIHARISQLYFYLTKYSNSAIDIASILFVLIEKSREKLHSHL